MHWSSLLAIGEPSLQQSAILAGLLATVLGLLWTSRRRAKNASRRPFRNKIEAATRGQGEVATDVAELLRELEALARRIDRQIENRLSELRSVLAEADRRIAALHGLISSSSDPGPATNRPSIERPPASPDNAPPVDERRRRIYELADAGASPADIARQTGRLTGEVELILNLRPGRTSDRIRA